MSTTQGRSQTARWSRSKHGPAITVPFRWDEMSIDELATSCAHHILMTPRVRSLRPISTKVAEAAIAAGLMKAEPMLSGRACANQLKALIAHDRLGHARRIFIPRALANFYAVSRWRANNPVGQPGIWDSHDPTLVAVRDLFAAAFSTQLGVIAREHSKQEPEP